MVLVYKQLDPMPTIMQQALHCMGWHEWDEDQHEEDEWNLVWKATR